ncbi:hypothetical protein [Neisseria sp. Ec49-e6-T10]|uniref:hypothetical protein n=1 Tax=Neisseria sp. Ec49-e6-T10 TaxID=3140744 RepID=UPI003EBF0FDD
MSHDNQNEQQNIPFQGMPPFGYPYPPHMQQQMQGYGWPPVWPYPYPPNNMQMPQQNPPQQQATAPQFDITAQAQGMVDNLMGEQSGLLKNIISTIGVDDKEFWKGAMIGAAAALILSNENVRQTFLNLFFNAGDILKTAGVKVKDAAVNTADTAKETVTTSSEIFRDTLKAGKEGFQQSVTEHKEAKQAAPKKVATKSATPAKTTRKTAATKRTTRTTKTATTKTEE